jgi:hypothetical protein
VKVSLATTNRPAPGGQFVLGARSLPGNPFDGHRLAAQIAQTERITGFTIERAHVDRGYRGHDAEDRKRSPATLLSRGGMTVLGRLQARCLEMALWTAFRTRRRAGIGGLRF